MQPILPPASLLWLALTAGALMCLERGLSRLEFWESGTGRRARHRSSRCVLGWMFDVGRWTFTLFRRLARLLLHPFVNPRTHTMTRRCSHALTPLCRWMCWVLIIWLSVPTASWACIDPPPPCNGCDCGSASAGGNGSAGGGAGGGIGGVESEDTGGGLGGGAGGGDTCCDSDGSEDNNQIIDS